MLIETTACMGTARERRWSSEQPGEGGRGNSQVRGGGSHGSEWGHMNSQVRWGGGVVETAMEGDRL